MALVHEKLYQSKDLGRVEMAEYARQLMNDLFQINGAAASKIQLRLELEPVLVPVDVAIPCGLILNELTTNAIRHAFDGRSSGEISVQLLTSSPETVQLTFADDGRGFSPQQDWRSADTLGLQLVRMLTDQLQGTINMINGRGWICVALVVFASWRPGKALLGALLFAFFDALQLRLQQSGAATEALALPYQFYLMLPYILSIVALVVVARKAAYPQALMKPYIKGER